MTAVGPGRRPFDVESYVARVRGGPCFVCALVRGDPAQTEHVIARTETAVAFLARWPTQRGYALLAPLEHREDVVADFTLDEYLDLQAQVHRLGRAVAAAVPTERLYVLSLGSRQGNAHVHWHVVPLPPGVPYEEQQYAALDAERGGWLDLPDDELAALAAAIRRGWDEPTVPAADPVTE